MRKKTKVIDKTMTIENQNDNPGSGTYENPEALSPKGKYYMSKHKGTGATLFNPKRSIRFFQLSILSLIIKKMKFLDQEDIKKLITYQMKENIWVQDQMVLEKDILTRKRE